MKGFLAVLRNLCPPRRLAALMLVVPTLTCSPGLEDQTVAPFQVQLIGCAEVLARDGTCLVRPDDELEVWTGAPVNMHWTLELDGVPAKVARRVQTMDAQGVVSGERWTLGRLSAVSPLPAAAPEASYDTAPRTLALTLHLPGEPPLRQVRRLALVPEELSEAARETATLRDLWSKAFRGPRPEEALPHSRRLVTLSRELGHLGSECLDSARWLHILATRGDPEGEADQLMARLNVLASECRAVRVEPAYYSAEYAYWSGDLPSAQRYVREALQATERRGVDPLYLNTRSLQALIELGLGRAPAAVDILRTAQPLLDSATPALAGPGSILLQNLGWILTDTSTHAEAPEAVEAASALERALALASPDDAAARVSILADLTLALVRAGRLDEAEATLASATTQASDAEPFVRGELLWAGAELELARAHGPRARSLFEALGQSARGNRDLMWESRHGVARALAAEGRRAEADRAYRECISSLDEASVAIPLGVGRETFLGRSERAAAEHVDLLLDADPAAAAQAARTYRSRALSRAQWPHRLSGAGAGERARLTAAIARYRLRREAILDEAKRQPSEPPSPWWMEREIVALAELDAQLKDIGLSMPSPELPALAPAADEVILLYHPVPRGWVGFAIGRGGVRAARLGPLPTAASPSARAAHLLEPFAPELEAARAVRLLVSGAVDQLEIHALPWRGAPLGKAKTVSYAVDVETPATGTPSAAARAVLVGNPTRDLGKARDEVAAIGALLEERTTLEVEVLSPEEATVEKLREVLLDPRTAVFHFAGHAVGGEFDGSRGALRLGGNARLSIGEILTLERVPEVVVLSACEAAAASAEARVAALGVAQAFVLGGARVAIAPTTAVDDGYARDTMVEVYRHLGGAPTTWDAADALRWAARAADTDGKWPFRVFVR